jgi:hypothetical protein
MYAGCKTQKQLKKCVREKIDEIGVCHSIKEYYPEEWNEFMYLFERHSDYPEKFNGLKDIKIRYNPVWKTQLEVIIIKNNGEEDDVSVLNNCISGKPKDNLAIAMRNSVYPQIKNFKDNSILKCVLCSDTKCIHIDHHDPQFIDLKTEFLSIWERPIPSTFEQNDSHSKIFANTDNKFEKSWIEFHRTNAILRVLCKKCNLSRKKVGV